MDPDEAGELRRTASALFEGLRRLDVLVAPGAADLGHADAIAIGPDTPHLLLHGKVCTQMLYRLGTDHSRYDPDAAVTLASALLFTLNRLADAWPGEATTALTETARRLDRLVMGLDEPYR